MFGGESNQLFLCSDRIVCIVTVLVGSRDSCSVLTLVLAVRQTRLMLHSDLTWHSAVLFPPDQVQRHGEGQMDQSSSWKEKLQNTRKKCSRFFCPAWSWRRFCVYQGGPIYNYETFLDLVSLVKRNVFNNKFRNVLLLNTKPR